MDKWTTALPSPAFADVVEFFWFTEPSATGKFEVIPDGRLDFALVASPARPRFEIFGPATVQRLLSVEPGVAYAGFRLRAGYSATLLDDDAWRYADHVVVTDRLASLHAEELMDVATVEQLEDRLGCLARRVAERASSKAVLARMACKELLRSEGHLRIEELAAKLGVSRRVLERVFRSEVGIGPKGFARIARLESLAERLRDGLGAWSELALELGFADQAHMIREVRRLSGHTPTIFAERVRQMPLGWV